MPTLSDEDALRKAVLVPCTTKESLRDWIRFYLDLDFPDTLVDPNSTTTPFEALWSLYDRMHTNSDPDLDREMWVAARDSFKSLGAATLEVLVMLHLGRDVGHMAAQESQALNVQKYVKQSFQRPYLRDYLVSDNVTKVEVRWYQHSETGDTMTPAEWKGGVVKDVVKWVMREYSIQIVIATVRGANCFLPGTMVVMEDGSKRPIESVSVGESVLGVDLASRENRVLKVGSVSTTIKDAMRVTFSDGDSVVLSEDHPLMADNGWRRTRALKVGSRLLDWGADPIQTQPQVLGSYVKFIDPRQVLLGMLLGDSCVAWPKSPAGVRYGCGPRLIFGHATPQAELFKAQVVAAELFGLTIRTKIDPAKFNGFQKGEFHSAISLVSEKLVELEELFYSNGKKVVTQEILDLLGPEALAHWIMDDGCANSVEFGASKERLLTLATCGFSKPEHDLIVGWFRLKWGLSCHVGNASNQSGAEYPILVFDMESGRKLAKLVDSFFIPSMRYKLPVPVEFMDSRCIDCGKEIAPSWDRNFIRRGKFRRCPDCKNPSSPRQRSAATAFKSRFTKEVARLEFLGPQGLVDLHIATDEEQCRNFWVATGSSRILAHNSLHVPFLCVDEVDIAPYEPYQEAKNIPTERDGNYPVTLLVSTRKSRHGLVQREMDEAAESGLKVKHWNIYETSKACETARHKPELPHVQLYVDDQNLKHINEEEFLRLPQDKKDKFRAVEGFAGCEKCPIFSSCLGHLAKVKIRSGKLLKSVRTVISKFRSNDQSRRIAQLLCRSPDTGGLIYPHLDPEIHCITAARMAVMIDGDERPETFSKTDLILLMKAQGEGKFTAGLDHGFGHNFAVASHFRHGQFAFVFDCQSQAELELEDKIKLMDETVKDWNPLIFPDTSDPGSNKSISKKGYNVRRDWNKGAGSVKAGINIVRSKLRPLQGVPTLYFLKGDEGVEFLVKQLGKYHWKKNAAGVPTEEPDKVDDDEADSLRYGIMNDFWEGAKVVMASDREEKKKPSLGTPAGPTVQNYLTTFIQQAVGEYDPLSEEQPANLRGAKGKSGRFKWNLG